MKPATFAYVAPDSLEEALAILAEHGTNAKILAGGQSLIPAMNFRLASAELVVDLNKIVDLDFVKPAHDLSLHIGAMTRQRSLESNTAVEQSAPLLHEAIPFIAHPQIRNRGTIGGSLVHADPAAELPVVMVALDARFILKSLTGERQVTAREFFRGMFEVDIRPDEALVEIILPRKPLHSGAAFMEIARRRGDYAMMGVAVLVELDSRQRCTAAELVYLNAGDRPHAAVRAAQVLIGKPSTPEIIAEAAHIAAHDEIEPLGNIHATEAYQRHLAEVLTFRGLNMAFARASLAAIA
jgi:CO/xanthine dehydrogenase FAD-binding subunit